MRRRTTRALECVLVGVVGFAIVAAALILAVRLPEQRRGGAGDE
jgi:hypothetical protein